MVCGDTGPGELDPPLPGAAEKQDVLVTGRDGTAVGQRLSNIPVSPAVSAEPREHHRANGDGVWTHRRHPQGTSTHLYFS